MGDFVRVRRRRWRVRDVRTHDDCQVVTLVGVSASEFGNERRVIAPFDTIEPLTRPPQLRLVSRRRWRRACRALVAADAPPGALRWAGRPRIDLLPHQLEPALAVVRGLGSRLLLADDVGLGKTIQAALILSELRERAAADRALILTPAGLRDQWIGELASRFDIAATIVDSRDIRRRRAELPIGINPWSTATTAVASIDFVKRPEILSSVAGCRWDVLIVDEAHNVAGDNDRHAACAALAARAAYVLLLTATPHNGDRSAFLSLCALGAHDDPLLVYRRTRREVGLGSGRRVRLLDVRQSAAERRVHSLVARFSRAALEDAADDRAREAVWLALTVLNKRALSSAQSLLHTVERRLAAAETSEFTDPCQLGLPLLDPDGDTDSADQMPDLAGLTLRDPALARTLLEELAEAARRAAQRETKIAALVRLLRRVAEPVVVFTEYRDTLLHVERQIGRPAAVLHGGLSRDERSAALEDFVSGRRSVLLATDAAGEGLNLHHTCRIVINLELPWNPMRLEQRIGRVDRIGQRRRVHAVHLIARDTNESRILERLRARVARAQSDVGAADPLDAASERTMAHLIIDGVVSGANASELGAQDSQIAANVAFTSLKPDAEAEAARLARTRGFFTTGRAAVLVPDDMWLTFVRARRTRIALGKRVLLLFRAACEDGGGRMLESTLIPVAIDWPSGRTDRRTLQDFLALAVPAAMKAADPVLSAWRKQATTAACRALETRLARERAIASLTGRRPRVLQPGLFDRRSERQDRVAQALVRDAVDESARRIAALERACRVAVPSPQLLLILAP